MERLTQWIGDGEDKNAIPRPDIRSNGHNRCCNKLAEYEDLEESGLLVKLPCKVGDDVFIVVAKEISRQKVKEITISDIGIELTTKRRTFHINDFSRNVFLTRKAAEEKLEELKQHK